jgi:uncharacterized RDD family membrane protein YckC
MIYAGFFRRFVALIIDSLIIFIPSWIAGVAIPFVGAVAINFLYSVILESSSAKSTPGKFLMGIIVLDENGQQLSFSKACIRYFMKFVSGMIMMIGYLIQFFTVKRQALHDIVAGAVVVHHSQTLSPNWVQAWLTQMRWLLKVDESVVDVTATSTSTSSPTPAQAPTSSDVTPQAAPAEAAQVNPSNVAIKTADQATAQIQMLMDLHKNGVLTDQEFQTKKSEILNKVLDQN